MEAVAYEIPLSCHVQLLTFYAILRKWILQLLIVLHFTGTQNKLQFNVVMCSLLGSKDH